MYNFTLYMTTDCNFKCQYCYEDYHNHYQLNEKTLVDSLEFMMNYGDRGKVLIDFLGGEPLLKKDLIYKAVAYIKDNYPEREVKYYITTNCSMMDDRFIAFMKENHFTVRLSFDGNKAGLTTCYVTTDGGIYTCAELPEFKIGSVEAGLDVPRIREIIYLEDQEDTMCKKCQYIRHCKTRGCQVANYEIHQNVYQPIKVNCEVTKWMYHLIQTNLTEKQLEKLKQEYERRYLRHGK